MYSNDEPASITTVNAKGIALRSNSVIPKNTCTGVTFVKPNINGVPSSVKLQIKIILPPANIPGRIKGKVIRRRRVYHPAPRLRAASCSAGSTFAKDVTKFKYNTGYRCNASIAQTAQKRPSPARKFIRSNPRPVSTALNTP